MYGHYKVLCFARFLGIEGNYQKYKLYIESFLSKTEALPLLYHYTPTTPPSKFITPY